MEESEARDINDLISIKSLEHHKRRCLLEAELLRLSNQMRHFDRVKYDVTRDGEEHASAFKRLSAAREQLMERLRPLRKPLDGVSAAGLTDATRMVSHQGLVQPRFGRAGEGTFLFGTEGCVAVPRASEGVSVVPGTAGTHGRIVTTGLFPGGGISFNSADPTGEVIGLGLSELGTDVEHVWLQNWRYVVLFPCATSQSTLTYKFEVDIDARLFSESAGTIMSFVSIGEEPSVSPNSNIEVDTPAGWLLVADLDEPSEYYSGYYGRVYGSASVERSFTVGAERTPAVAIVVGFIVRLTSGQLRLSFAGDSGIGVRWGRVCYRYTPIPILSPT